MNFVSNIIIKDDYFVINGQRWDVSIYRLISHDKFRQSVFFNTHAQVLRLCVNETIRNDRLMSSRLCDICQREGFWICAWYFKYGGVSIPMTIKQWVMGVGIYLGVLASGLGILFGVWGYQTFSNLNNLVHGTMVETVSNRHFDGQIAVDDLEGVIQSLESYSMHIHRIQYTGQLWNINGVFQDPPKDLKDIQLLSPSYQLLKQSQCQLNQNSEWACQLFWNRV